MNKVKYQMAQTRPELLPLFKLAADNTDTLPSSAFADNLRTYPIHSPDDAVLSKLAALENGAEQYVMSRIDKALSLYKVDATKFAAYTQKEATEQPVPVHYLLPQNQAIPVPTAGHLKEASEALVRNSKHMSLDDVSTAAINAVKLGGVYGMDVTDLPSTLYKFAGLTECDVGLLLDWVDARVTLCPHGTTERDTFSKIAASLEINFPRDGILRDRAVLVKLASALDTLDKQANLQGRYGRTLLSPLEAVFNMDKLAGAEGVSCTIAGNAVPLSKIQALPDADFDEFFGEGASAQKMDDATCKSMCETLPADIQQSLYANLKSYLT